MATSKPTPQQAATAAAAAAKAKNAAIQQPVNTAPAPNMAALTKIAPSLASQLVGKIGPAISGYLGKVSPQPTSPAPKIPPRPVPQPVVGPGPKIPSRPVPQPVVDPGFGYVPGVGQPLAPSPFPTFQPPGQITGLGDLARLMGGVQLGSTYTGPITPNMGSTAKPQTYQDYLAGRNPMQHDVQLTEDQFNQGQLGFAQPYYQGLGATATSRAAPQSNPMTGLGAFSANPNIATANPFAGLGLTAGAQQAQQGVPAPYSPIADTFQGTRQPPSSFSQSVGQLFGTLAQPQTQQSPYAAQQASNLMQNTGQQVGQGVYGSFVGQQKPQQQAMQQQAPQQQNNQAMQNPVAPPMQAGFNFFNQGQNQGNTGGGGTTGGGGLF